MHAEADWWPDGSQNATQNFWRSAEGLSVTPTDGLDRWAVSQAAPYRRMHVRGNLALSDGGWSSGGFMADTKIDGQIQSGSQQQWITRNSQMGSWNGSNWNQVFVGAQGAPAQQLPDPAVHDGRPDAGRRREAVPVRRRRAATTRSSSRPCGPTRPAPPGRTATRPGTSLPISTFYVVKPGDTAATINAALAAGKNLLVTPGVYNLNQTLNVTRANTVVLGLGLATFVPQGGIAAMTVADVDGVTRRPACSSTPAPPTRRS